jgi:UDP-N-acetylglucosamine 1-carboxyvinyltransferase
MSVSIVLATQTKGTVLFFEKMFESRMYFVDHLMSMGANIIQCDPHRVVVIGPSKLKGSKLTSPDIRAGMAMLIAACCADGESLINNAQVIDRGYEAIEDRLSSLGVDIIREN